MKITSTATIPVLLPPSPLSAILIPPEENDLGLDYVEGLREKGEGYCTQILSTALNIGQTRNKNRTGDNGGRCHLFVKAPRPKGANVVDVLLVSRSTRFSGPGAFPRRLHVTRLYGWRRLRGLGSRRTDPDFDEICIAIATIDDDDATSIDSARNRQVIHRAAAKHVCLSGAAGTTRVDDDVSSRVWCVLQLNGQIIETRLVIVKSDRRELPKLAASFTRPFRAQNYHQGFGKCHG